MATVNQTLLTKVKNYLRRSHDKLDDDLGDHIAACLRDLEVYGVNVTLNSDKQEIDPLIISAVKLYCKSEDTKDPAEATLYRARYDALKASLGMASEYKGAAANE